MGKYDNNLWNSHFPYCLFLFILLFCRVELLQKPMKKSLSAIYSTLPCPICTPPVLSYLSMVNPTSYRGEQKQKRSWELQQKRSSFHSSFLPPQIFLLFPPLLEKLPALPDFFTKLKSQWCKRFNYISDIQKGCDCII